METELHQIDEQITLLRNLNSSGEGPFDANDVEYLRLLARKVELGFVAMNPEWFRAMARKVEATLNLMGDAT